MRAAMPLFAVLIFLCSITSCVVAARWREDMHVAHQQKGVHHSAHQGILVLVPKASKKPTELGIADIAHALRIIKAHAWPRSPPADDKTPGAQQTETQAVDQQQVMYRPPHELSEPDFKQHQPFQQWQHDSYNRPLELSNRAQQERLDDSGGVEPSRNWLSYRGADPELYSRGSYPAHGHQPHTEHMPEPQALFLRDTDPTHKHYFVPDPRFYVPFHRDDSVLYSPGEPTPRGLHEDLNRHMPQPDMYRGVEPYQSPGEKHLERYEPRHQNALPVPARTRDPEDYRNLSDGEPEPACRDSAYARRPPASRTDLPVR